jgi:cell division protein FtsI (penicillin-binding protein 3)
MRGIQFHASPVLAIKLPAWRSRLVMLLLLAGFVALLARALFLQAFSTDFLQSQGELRYARTLEMPATRGKIMDRNGVVLASSVPAWAIWAIPEDVDASGDQLNTLARLLDVPATEIKKKTADEDHKFVYLKRQVSPELADQVERLNLSGIHERKEFHRFYSEGETMAHLLGFTNVEDVGQEGLELAWEKELAGQNGSRRVIKDRLGRVIEDVASIRVPHDGQDLRLSIDGQIQYLAFSQLKSAIEAHHARAGAIVVLDVRTGEVLALANWPTYNPNDRSDLTGAQLRNRVLTDTYEPGSTLKPFTIALALDKGVVTPQTLVNTAPGKLTIGTATISDSHAHGTISVEDIIKVSSNIGTAKIALRMDPKDMWEMYTSVGLGQVPHLGFPGAVAGRLRPFKNWRPIEQATMSYGYGLSVSLMQMARAYTIFARNGDMVPPTLFKTDQPASSVQVVPPGIAAEMRHMLEQAAGPGGTAPKAQVMGYRVAGKTGTAHKLVDGAYSENKYVGSFVGFAPVSNPRIVVAVMIDEPTDGVYYGGDVAAPVFSAVVGGALRSLNVEPDSPIKSLIIPNDALPESP